MIGTTMKLSQATCVVVVLCLGMVGTAEAIGDSSSAKARHDDRHQLPTSDVQLRIRVRPRAPLAENHGEARWDVSARLAIPDKGQRSESSIPRSAVHLGTVITAADGSIVKVDFSHLAGQHERSSSHTVGVGGKLSECTRGLTPERRTFTHNLGLVALQMLPTVLEHAPIDPAKMPVAEHAYTLYEALMRPGETHAVPSVVWKVRQSNQGQPLMTLPDATRLLWMTIASKLDPNKTD